MATSYPSDTDNWLLAAVGLKYLKEGLEEFTDQSLRKQHEDFLKALPAKTGQCIQCIQCTINNILPSHNTTSCRKAKCWCRDKKRRRLCPVGQCSQMHDLIASSHRTGEPNWSNTDPQKWHANHISIGACFINTPGYKLKRSITEIDCSGILSIMINNKLFDQILGGGNAANCSDDLKKALDARNEIFHEPNLQLLSSKMQHYISLFIKILNFSKIQNTPVVQTALEKLAEIKSGNYLLSKAEKDDVLKYKERATSELEVAASFALKKIDDTENRIDVKAERAIALVDQVSQQSSQRINVQTDQAVAMVEKVSKQLFQRTDTQTQHTALLAPLSEWWQKRNLKRDLITYYRREFNTLSISPLFQKNDAPLLQLYATPSFYHIEETSESQDLLSGTFEMNTYRVGKSMKRIGSLKEIFFYNQRLNHCIYVTADAGYGKTSFSKKLLIDWCQAQDTVKSDMQFYQESEVAIMKYFDYLFFVPLRKYRHAEYLDDMLHSQLVNCLHHRYTKSFLKNTLEKKRCLIIIDGLDEWMPLEGGSESEIPEWKFRNTCSVLITTRLWKFSTLSPKPTDIHVEMSGFNVADSRELACRAITFLNQKYGTDKSSDIFCNELVEHNLHDLAQVPLLLMQCLCLWFDGKSLGKSHCEIYFNLIEFLSLKNEGRLSQSVTESAELQSIGISLPNWFRENRNCCSQFNYLVALGKLSFFTLFSTDRTPSLVFDRTVAGMYITPDELAFAKDIGLLTIEKSYGKQSSRQSTISFIHKTYQEVLAALYIATQQSPSDKTYNTINQFCQSVENILAVSNVFKFLCGLCAEKFERIAEMFTPVLTKYSRHLIPSEFDNTLFSYQKMIIKCYEEACSSDTRMEHDFKLFDILLNGNMCVQDLTFLKHTDKTDVISLNMSGGAYSSFMFETVTDVLRKSVDLKQLDLRPTSLQHNFNILDVCCFKHIQSLSLANFEVSNLDLSSFLQLQFLHLHALELLNHLNIPQSLCWLELQNLTCLEGLNLSLSKSLIQLHLNTLSNITQLELSACTQLQLVHLRDLQEIKQLDLSSCKQLQKVHLENLWGIEQLDLSSCEQLQYLHLESISRINQLDLSTYMQLQKLHIKGLLDLKQLDISGCTHLQHLHLANLQETNRLDMSACIELQTLHLEDLKRVEKLDLSACRELQQLHLKGLREVKSLDLIACVELQHLHLEELLGIEQLEHSACTKLRHLHLEYLWVLTEFKPLGFSHLKQLYLVDLQGFNNLDLSSCTRLEHLQLTGLKEMKQLDISACRHLQLLHVKNCQKINQLHLSACSKLVNLHIINLKKLKQLKLSACTKLQQLHLENIHRLKNLDLSACVHLQQLYLSYLVKMKRLEMSECTQLQSLHLEYLWSIKQLDLSSCQRIHKLNMKGLQDMKLLDMSVYTRLQQLHLEDLKGIKLFDLSMCTQIQQLHLKDLQGIKQLDLSACTQRRHLCMKGLQETKLLDLSACTRIQQLHLENIKEIKKLDLTCCAPLYRVYLGNLQGLNQLDISGNTQLQFLRLENLQRLEKLDLSACTHLQNLHLDFLPEIKHIDLSARTHLQQFSVKGLTGIERLNMSACIQLQQLHMNDLQNMTELDVSACTELQTIHMEDLKEIERLDLSACTQLHQLHLGYHLRLNQPYIPDYIQCQQSNLSTLRQLDLSACAQLQQLHLYSIREMQFLDLSACKHLKQLRLDLLLGIKTLDLSDCRHLQQLCLKDVCKLALLDLSACIQLQRLHLENVHEIQQLDLSACTVITNLHLESLLKLEQLNLSSCTELQEVYFSNIPIPAPDLLHCPSVTDGDEL
ncbi:uncharacterized protein LOC123563809 [Mercenaria mercenaria]|uniref:uncharacterized protein LOC123563809 n=1 Tax=Mercenaria mercenaria TaxID=6596 RepID=UPI00234EE523|nr:uncharacterized protein LOC123563809 [Mercenaria mercenaria]